MKKTLLSIFAIAIFALAGTAQTTLWSEDFADGLNLNWHKSY